MKLRDLLGKLGLLDNLPPNAPFLDMQLIIEDPLSQERDKYTVDGIFIGDGLIHFHMGREILDGSD